jgi:ABC-type dipeptide/oligopeptide/nickel transport system ATPase component
MTTPLLPLIELRGVSKRFAKSLDLAEKLARELGLTISSSTTIAASSSTSPISPLDPPPRHHFQPRCPHAMALCRLEAPVLRDIAYGHLSACHLNDRT